MVTPTRDGVRAEQLAAQLLAQHHDGGPPVMVDAIAQAAGAQVAYNHHPGGLEAAFVWRRSATAALIGVNSAFGRRRQRFAAAHSLGHLLLHPHRVLTVDYIARDGQQASPSLPSEPEEAVANRFAVALLTPEQLVRDHLAAWVRAGLADLPGRDALLLELAREFGVSPEAMGFRLLDLGVAFG